MQCTLEGALVHEYLGECAVWGTGAWTNAVCTGQGPVYKCFRECAVWGTVHWGQFFYN